MISNKLKNIKLLINYPTWHNLYCDAINQCDKEDIFGYKSFNELIHEVVFQLAHLGNPTINGVENKYYRPLMPEVDINMSFYDELRLLEKAPIILSLKANGSFLSADTMANQVLNGKTLDKNKVIESLCKHLKVFDNEIPNIVKILTVNANTSSGRDNKYDNNHKFHDVKTESKPTVYEERKVETPDVDFDPFDVAVMSPCDGTIDNIHVSANQIVRLRTLLITIKKDDGTIVSVTAPCKGIIQEIFCYKDFIVRKGELLCVIDKRIPKGESLFDKYKKLPRWKKILICIGIFLVIYLIVGMISVGIYSSKLLQEEKEAEEYRQYAESLRQELLANTIPIDDSIPKAKRGSTAGRTYLKDNECAYVSGSVYYVENGAKVKKPYIIYYKITRTMINDEAVDFIVNKLGPIFKDEYEFYSVVNINDMDTDNYDYVVIEISADDSEIVNNYPMDEYFSSVLDAGMSYDDNNYHKTLDKNYSYSIGSFSLIETHDSNIHVYPMYIVAKMEKGYNNYWLGYNNYGVYDSNDTYDFTSSPGTQYYIKIQDMYN